MQAAKEQERTEEGAVRAAGATCPIAWLTPTGSLHSTDVLHQIVTGSPQRNGERVRRALVLRQQFTGPLTHCVRIPPGEHRVYSTIGSRCRAASTRQHPARLVQLVGRVHVQRHRLGIPNLDDPGRVARDYLLRAPVAGDPE